MRVWRVTVTLLFVLTSVLLLAQQKNSTEAVPKYDPTAEAVFKGTVDEVRDRECPVSRGMGAHIILKTGEGKTIEVHLATTKFVKSYELAFNKGDTLEVTGVKVKFENVDTIFAREIKRGNDTFVFRDKEGRPIW
jgi:DNA/RNA endonuclease YhcR with UshA esterase domain